MELTYIRDLRAGAKNLNLTFIVLEIGRPCTTKEGHEIRTCKVADRSGSILLSVWGDIGTYIQCSDILRLNKGYVSLWKGIPTLYVGKGGELMKTGEFCFIFNEANNMSDVALQQQQQQNQTSTAVVKLDSDGPQVLTVD